MFTVISPCNLLLYIYIFHYIVMLPNVYAHILNTWKSIMTLILEKTLKYSVILHTVLRIILQL